MLTPDPSRMLPGHMGFSRLARLVGLLWLLFLLGLASACPAIAQPALQIVSPANGSIVHRIRRDWGAADPILSRGGE